MKDATVKDDIQLIDDALEGDSEAFGQLVLKYQDRLFNTMMHVVRSREEAEDVVQEAFVQAFVKLDSFQCASAFYTWLYRIAVNLALSKRRRKRSRSKRSRSTMSLDQVREQSGSEPADRQAGPEGVALRHEQIERLWAALDRLPHPAREILVLRELEGCRYETIGEILQLPVGTVRSRLFRARLQLRACLQDMLSGGSE